MLQLGQVLTGRLGSYKLTQKLYRDTVWLAVNQQVEQKVIIKYKAHYCVQRELNILRHFQGWTQHIRPLVDEIEMENEGNWPALVLKWLDDDALHTCNTRPLSPAEIKRVGSGVLKALALLHEHGYVHTDVKPNNVLVNYDSEKQISDVQLADFGCTMPQDSSYAKDGKEIGAAIFRSPEAMLAMRWDTSTDVWSFGAMMITLIYGRNFDLFSANVPLEHEDYEIQIMLKQTQYFGPFPLSYQEIADGERLEVLTWLMENSKGHYTPFRNITNREVSEEDKRFLLKVMKLDPRDRPTAKELLADEWFTAT